MIIRLQGRRRYPSKFCTNRKEKKRQVTSDNEYTNATEVENKKDKVKRLLSAAEDMV
jgi:hypothetical protein